MRDYINERGAGRSFNLDSFTVQKKVDPHHLVIEFLISQRGADQLEPFQITLAFGEPAARQVQEALYGALATEPGA
jgi:hypothetical protein